MIIRNSYTKPVDLQLVRNKIESALKSRDVHFRLDVENETYSFSGLRCTSTLVSGSGKISFVMNDDHIQIRYGLETSPTFAANILVLIGLLLVLVGAMFAWIAIQHADEMLVREFETLIDEVQDSIEIKQFLIAGRQNKP